MSVYSALLRDLAVMPEDIANSATAEAALNLARRIDEGTLMSPPQAVREIRECMKELRARAQVAEPKQLSVVDEIRQRREKKSG